MDNTARKTSTPLADSLRRLGIGGFLFFFAKGLLWLALPWVAHLAVG